MVSVHGLGQDRQTSAARRHDLGHVPNPAGGRARRDRGTLSQVGTKPGGRAGLSLLSAVGLPALIAHSADEFVATATRLASDRPATLATYRMELGDKKIPVKNIYVPLCVKGRRWGNLEIAYRDD